ncbi:MAG: hypothetical protein A3F74_20150 [Betaproteobacteria bacterium RIFCSPLOWO2_12_FULL_62_58]|nr:MAG: hypothetical protein A3F74_20150 [Betaproteobacteria bacterium RIFCSPLOWO2_12_FULL_62_58]OGT01685.1 MAG: hypothetical protein A2Z65_11860 [Gallionellales bacterium RIFCSPLOWO2_02_58_13]
MNIQRLPRLRPAAVALAAILYVTGKSLAQYFGLDDFGVGLFSEAAGMGNAGLVLVWAIAHCDGLDGPVVMLARKALDAGNVNLVLPWVQARDEREIRNAFEQALSVRRMGPAAKEMADRHFFETLVRIHRAGEGAPYTGLKPAGRDLGPAIPAADRALVDGSVEAVVTLVTDAVAEGIREYFQAAWRRKGFDPNDVTAGREYVEAYVPYIHYVERLYEAATKPAHGHHQESEESLAHAH